MAFWLFMVFDCRSLKLSGILDPIPVPVLVLGSMVSCL